MHRYFLILLTLLTSMLAWSQAYDPLNRPNTYRSSENPNYWKNKLPDQSYWQQDVHYEIDANILEQKNIIEGKQILTYWNNSPDTLTFGYFHLYQNAFQPESYYDNLLQQGNSNPRYGPYEKEKKGTVISKIEVNETELRTELDNTILKVWFPEPILPGDSIQFNILFKTYFGSGSVRRRMKQFDASGFTHYNGVHWYPRIAVYDRKFKWTTDQHLGKEFYGDFGTFDVNLTFSSNYVVEATGFLLNRKEVLPDELRQKLDIKNFNNKPWGSPASVVTPYDSTKRKTWKFHAENVHDFAFTADPTYRIGEATWNGIKCIALVREPHAIGWQNAADYTAKTIKTFSEDIGMYTYHKMIVADAKDGMEYPMITLDGGYDPNYRRLFVHEIGHNWFFGQVGSNETYRAALDEGFTQFLTSWGLEKIEGDTMPYVKSYSKYRERFKKKTLTRYSNVFYAYLRDALQEKDPMLNTHSDQFYGPTRRGGYHHVYYKTASMLYNLQYVLGDELFLKAMQHYFSKWKIAHPYFEDFKSAIIDYTKTDLNWFFDQWLETTKTIDYAIQKVQKGENNDEYIITFKRNGRMQMPIDFQVTAKDGKKYDYYIPNTWFEKETSATKLPRWIGWDKVQKTYQARVIVPKGVKSVQIDPSNRLADVNRLDNSSNLPILLELDHQIYNTPDNQFYQLKTRPDLWYNGVDGMKAGVHLNGNYMNYKHRFTATVWGNTSLLRQETNSSFEPLSYRVNYNTPLSKFMKGSSFFFESKFLDGLYGNEIGFDKKSNSTKTKIHTSIKSTYRNDIESVNYLINEEEWNINRFNNVLHLGLDHSYRIGSISGTFNVLMRSSVLTKDFAYSAISASTFNNKKIGKLYIKSRLFGQLGFGDNWAPESQLFLSGANPEGYMENKYMRSRGFFPSDWYGYGNTTNHLQFGGGLNLRGYSGYYGAVEAPDGNIRNIYKGTSGASANIEVEFNQLIGINPRFLRNTFRMKTYLFGDVGTINYNTPSEPLLFSELRADAGIGTTLTIQRWGALEMVKPLTIRFDVPFYLSHIPFVEQRNFDFRWIVGINRAF